MSTHDVVLVALTTLTLLAATVGGAWLAWSSLRDRSPALAALVAVVAGPLGLFIGLAVWLAFPPQRSEPTSPGAPGR